MPQTPLGLATYNTGKKPEGKVKEKWNAIMVDPEFQSFPYETKQLIQKGFFNQIIDSDLEYQMLDKDTQQTIKTNFFLSMPPEFPEYLKEPTTDIGGALKTGLGESLGGLALKEPGEGMKRPKGMGDTFAEELLMGGASAVADIPTYAISAAATTVSLAGSTLNPGGLTAAAASFAFPSMLRSILEDRAEKGDLKGFADLATRMKDAYRAFGEGAISGLGMKGTGKLGKKLSTKAEFPAEIAGLTTTQSTLEGRLPTTKDFLSSGIILGGMRISGKFAKKLKKQYGISIEKLNQTLETIERNPDVAKNIQISLKDLNKSIPKISRLEELSKAEQEVKQSLGIEKQEPREITKDQIGKRKTIPDKNLWEMTPAEFIDTKNLDRGGWTKTEKQQKTKDALDEHWMIIQDAVKRGVEVPNEVFNKYAAFNEAPIKPKDKIKFFGLKEEKGRISILKTKQIIRQKTRQIKLSSLIREDTALAKMMKRMEQTARKAFSVGNKEGYRKAMDKVNAMRERMRERKIYQGELNKYIKNLRNIDTSQMMKHPKAAIESIMKDIDLKRLNSKTTLKLQKIREYLANDPDGLKEIEMPDYMLKKLERLENKSIRDMTLDEVKLIHDTVLHYANQNKLGQKTRKSIWGRERDTNAKNAISEMKPATAIDYGTEPIEAKPQGKLGKTKDYAKNFFGINQKHLDLIIEDIAGNRGTAYKVLHNDVNNGVNAQLKYKQEAIRNLSNEFNNVSNTFHIENMEQWINGKIKTGRLTLTRDQRIELYLHSKNKNNLRHILKGGIVFRGEKGRLYKPKAEEIADVLSTLSAAEKEIADNVLRKRYEKQYTDINKVFYEKNGYELPYETNYYPIATAPIGLTRVQEKQGTLDALKSTFIRIGLFKGMLKDRTKSEIPIYLDGAMNTMNKNLNNVSAYVGLEIPLSKASRLLSDIKPELELRYKNGKDMYQAIDKGLRDIAGAHESLSKFERIVGGARRATTTAMLGMNPWVMAKQPISYMLFSTYIEPKHLIAGTLEAVFNGKEIGKLHREFSPDFTQRLAGHTRDISDVMAMTEAKKIYNGKRPLRELVMRGIQTADKGTVTAGMQGAVRQAMAQFKSGEIGYDLETILKNEGIKDVSKLTPRQKVQMAYKFADFVVQRTQPHFGAGFRSPMSRGSEIEKMMTQFSVQTNQNLNLIMRLYSERKRKGDPKALQKLGTAIGVIGILAPIALWGIDNARNAVYGREEKSWERSFIEAYSGMFYGARDIMYPAMQGYGKDFTLPSHRIANIMIQNIRTVGNMLDSGEATDKEITNLIDGGIELIMMSQGIPYRTPKSIIEGIAR